MHEGNVHFIYYLSFIILVCYQKAISTNNNFVHFMWPKDEQWIIKEDVNVLMCTSLIEIANLMVVLGQGCQT